MSLISRHGSLALVAGLLLASGMDAAWATDKADKQEANIKKKEQLRDAQKHYDIAPAQNPQKKTSGPKLQDLNVPKQLDKSSP